MPIDLLDQILLHIRRSIYPAVVDLKTWKIKEADLEDGSSTSLRDSSWSDFHVPSFWGGYDRTAWFRRNVTVPNEFSGKSVVLLLDLPGGLLYVDGEPFSGIDGNHQEVLLSPSARGGVELLTAIQAYSGRSKDVSYFNRAQLAVVSPPARALYHSLVTLRELEKLFGTGSPESKELKEVIRRTLIFLKYFDPAGEEYPNAIGRALSFIEKAIDTDLRTSIEGVLHLIAQSHLDVAWLSTMPDARRKCGRTISTVLRLMEEFPEFKFTQSQAYFYHSLKQDYPTLFKQLKQRIQEQRWIPIGDSWVEYDCHIPSGESLVRQHLYGRRFLMSEFGISSDICWLPNTFGFSAALPQILKKAGLTRFFTTKLNWNDSPEFPYHSFRWFGLDGTSILSHVQPTRFDGQLASKTIRKAWEDYKQKDLSRDAVLLFGHGDGGGGPAKDQILRSFSPKEAPGLPRVRCAIPREFFERLGEVTPQLPMWEGELYLQKHRGAYTTQGWLKRENRMSETAFYNMELLSTLAMLNGKSAAARKYPAREVEELWRRLLTFQFHDLIAGTAIADAYHDVKEGFEQIKLRTASLSNRALKALAGPSPKGTKDQRFTLFNTLGWSRSEYVELIVKSPEKFISVCDETGAPLEFQILGHSKDTLHLLCYVPEILPFGSRTVIVSPSDKAPSHDTDWKITARIIEGPIYRIRTDASGRLTSIYDKRLRRELVKKGQRANFLHTYSDKPGEYEAWDLDAGYESKRTDVLKFKSGKIVQSGPLCVVLRLVYRSANGSVLTQDMILYHKVARIDFRTHLKWTEKQTLLKVAFPTNIKTALATYETQFGSIQRPTKPRSPEDVAKFEVPAQQWADLSEPKFGVSLINDCKYGYDARESTLRLTLLRSPRFAHPTEPAERTDDRYTDQGTHEFAYALVSHKGDWRAGETARRAKEFNVPLLVLKNTNLHPVAPIVAGLPPGVHIDSVKKSEEGDEVILRMHEAHGEASKAKLEFGYSILQASECDLMEHETARLKPAKGALSLKFAHYEIKTLKLRLRAKKRNR
ncbi:MAG: alpha-mannosidase [Ignavibacteria bacterium]|nr:alpha-mannosidase [Ignavibacteria bacterium]